MSIEWLEAENAIDTRLSLAQRRQKLEARLAQDPADVGNALQLLSVLDQLGLDPGTITETLRPAFEAGKSDPALLGWLSLLSYRTNELKLAMVTARAAIEADAGELIANFVLAQILLRAGKFSDALSHVGKALDVGAASHLYRDIQRLHCIVLARLGRLDEAWQAQQQIQAAHPDETQALIDSADLLHEMARGDEAIKLLEAAAAHKPADTDLLFRLAVGHFEDGRNRAALDWANRLIAADSQHLEGWNLRAQIKLKLGDAAGALEDHDMIRELSKKQPLDQAFRAECFIAMGRKADAIAALKGGMDEVRHWPRRLQEYQAMLNTLTVEPPASGRGGPKLGPNDPCWCGSGRKLKKCHGA